jgi:hypothetical protein
VTEREEGPDPTSPALARQVAANAEVFDHLARLVELRTAEGRLDSALAWCRLAALFATCHPTGALRSVRLERTLDAISRATLEPSIPERTSDSRRIVHVLSEAHLVGGHVRMAQRWCEVDDRSVTSFVVTRPGCGSATLRRAATARGGISVVLQGRSLLQRARALRQLTMSADVVVCHTHCDDPVPAVAFGGDYAGPPVVLVNHADHQFFLGTGNVAVVANLRDPMGTDVTVRARGYPAANCAYLPVLVPEARPTANRAVAKERLGLDPRRPVALTLARAEKYRGTPQHPGFAEVVAPVFATRDDVQLVAVGPFPDDPAWARLVDEVGTRALVCGSQSEPERYLDAADLYLDSFPFASTTSLLEAASRDLPLVGIRLHRGMAGLLGGADILEAAVITADTVPAYRARLSEVLDDTAMRERWGRRAGALVRAHHVPEVWPDHLEALYQRAGRAEPCTGRTPPAADGSDELRDYACALLGVASGDSLGALMGLVADGFDGRDRLTALARRLPARVGDRLGYRHLGPRRLEAAILLPGAARGVSGPQSPLRMLPAG